MPASNPSLDAVLNLSKYHREHEKFYAQVPLEQALTLQRAARILQTFADRWERVDPRPAIRGSPYAGSEDLNEAATIQHTGVLFMEGEGEPAEIAQLKGELASLADGFERTGGWLAEAMQASWGAAEPLLDIPPLADVLGERHRIIANDWQAANLSTLIAQILRRSVQILRKVDFTPASIRADLAGPRWDPRYLHSAAELLDHAADLAAESAALVHNNERRWRVFRRAVEALATTAQAVPPEAGASLKEPRSGTRMPR